MSKVCHDSFYAMGTRCHLILPDLEGSRAEHLFSVVKHEINRVETCLSRFIPYSEIALINKNAGKEPVIIGQEVFDILNRCLNYHSMTAGAFDITLRPLIQYWKDQNSENNSRGLDKVMDAIGCNQIELNENDYSVFLNSTDAEIDLGGFGKGYALQKVYDQFMKFRIKDAFISFGESSILTLGAHPAGDHWQIGLNDYINPGQCAYKFTMNEGSVSTSSNFYVDDHNNLHNHRHVMNPFTGFPVEDFITVSVRAASPEIAEVLSTAFLVMPQHVIDLILTNVPECDIVKINYTAGSPDIQVLTNQKKMIDN
jgi:thiamine biosynthesis lipoprotein